MTDNPQALEAADAYVSIRSIYFAYGESLILRDVNLDIKRGEFISIVGPSGCGKTTLLKIVQGLLEPSYGTVSVDSVPVTGPAGNRSMVFQHFGLMPWKTVLQNVVLGLKYRGKEFTKAERTRRAVEYIRMVGLEGCENLFPRQLSGGMQQRVGIARAFATQPAVLLLDEPFGAVDAQNAEIMRSELVRLVVHEHRTAIMITHNLDEALEASDRVLVMGARGGGFIEDVRIDIPRGPNGERTEWKSSTEYHALRERMWTILRDEVVALQEAQIARSKN